jgi:hypothetical protein
MDNCVNTFRIGCDPEFGVINPDYENSSSEPVYCDCGCGEIVDGDEGCELIDVSSYGVSFEGQVGHDHGGEVVELRPNPSYTVSGLIKELKQLLDSPKLSKVRKFKWRAGAYYAGQAFGGHIHIELPFEDHHGVPKDVYRERINACDAVIRELERFNLHPQSECEQRRTGSGYGHFGKVTAAQCGEAGRAQYFVRMEYRTPCSWLFDPRIAYITLTGIKLAATNPKFALERLGRGNDTKSLWVNFVKFYRSFRLIDQDALYVCQKFLKTTNPEIIDSLKADTEKDIKEVWSKFSA